MDTNIAPKRIFLPLNLHLENPYATNAEDITVPNVAIMEINSEFLKNTANVTLANPFHHLHNSPK